MSHRVELIPEEDMLRQVTRKRLASWAAIAAASVFAVLMLTVSYNGRVRALSASVDPLREQVVVMEKRESLLAPRVRDFQAARQRGEVVRELLQEPSWSELLSDLAAASGEDLWLTRFSVSRDTVTDEAGSERAIALMSMSGMASSSSDLMVFMKQFSGSKHVDELGLERSSTAHDENDEGIVEFEISGIVCQ